MIGMVNGQWRHQGGHHLIMNKISFEAMHNCFGWHGGQQGMLGKKVRVPRWMMQSSFYFILFQ
jgi:hypothetical protein